jgi:hypothetical protein
MLTRDRIVELLQNERAHLAAEYYQAFVNDTKTQDALNRFGRER